MERPEPNQKDFLTWEFGVFFHFGIRSFYPGHRDWDNREMPPEGFFPDAYDPEQWVRTAKEAGATYTVLTAKHHDGFALWPSAYSHYSVKDTPWRDGKGDVVGDYVAACRKYGMKVGLYYSPAQWGSRTIRFTEGREYDEYFIHQVTELLTHYGKIDYLWFDGCGSAGHVYDIPRIVAEIRRLQPDILTFCDPEWMAGVRWIGNEDGYAPQDNPPDTAVSGKVRFLPAECDAKLRDTWFYDLNEESIKDVEELFGMYEGSVGHGSNFLLNVGPDNHGQLCAADVSRLLALGERIRAVYGAPAPYGETAKTGETTYEVHPCDPEAPLPLINRVVLDEDISEGAAVRAFRISVGLPKYRDILLPMYEGRTVGHKVICAIPAVRASAIRAEITDAAGEVHGLRIRAYFA